MPCTIGPSIGCIPRGLTRTLKPQPASNKDVQARSNTFFRVDGQTLTCPHRHFWLGTYADDFTMHRIIRSQADLAVAHKLILRLLDAVRALKLKVNQAKCAMLVKLCGRAAQSVLQKHTCWLPDTAGVLQRHWRLGQHKSWPAYRWESQIKYLGIQISYDSFEKQTLRYRIAEAAKKLQQVRSSTIGPGCTCGSQRSGPH